MACPGRGQQSVDGRRAQVQELLAHGRGNALLEIRQPERDNLLEPFAARLFARQPDRLERPEYLLCVIGRLRPGPTLGYTHHRTVEQSQRRLAVIPADRTKLV